MSTLCSLAYTPVIADVTRVATSPEMQWTLSSEPFCSQIHTLKQYIYDCIFFIIVGRVSYEHVQWNYRWVHAVYSREHIISIESSIHSRT